MSRISSSKTVIRSRRSAAAAMTGGVVIALIVLLGFLPLVTFLAGATASTAGLVPFPVLGVTAVALIGLLAIVALLAGSVTRRRAPAAWALSATAVVVAIVVTAFPLIAVVVGSVDRVGDLGAVVEQLVQRLGGGS
ncbi:MFS transporter permease [uncultured Microbacterium sp.]|uniref:MFS transporter permease n=1 Tax=uncultured Microbacterium sp. TaxID=191216 RepID=UPI0026110896|nr:MFS transporter permease [uncultured Microbacterium sp.]